MAVGSAGIVFSLRKHSDHLRSWWGIHSNAQALYQMIPFDHSCLYRGQLTHPTQILPSNLTDVCGGQYRPRIVIQVYFSYKHDRN